MSPRMQGKQDEGVSDRAVRDPSLAIQKQLSHIWVGCFFFNLEAPRACFVTESLGNNVLRGPCRV